jgi:PIN domain nuclease of toxin-antitoxin system
MRLLLDTHIALWAIADDARLPTKARHLIEDAENDILVSAATIWEIAIKHGLGRGGTNAMPISAPAALDWFGKAGYGLIDITTAHAAAVETLPPLHQDPFDRMLVAQALTEPLRLLTHDPAVAAYDRSVILV